MVSISLVSFTLVLARFGAIHVNAGEVGAQATAAADYMTGVRASDPAARSFPPADFLGWITGSTPPWTTCGRSWT
ncbi:hypothetical protein AB0C24_13645 [Amycolatopsis japonica]|uniref:hypothetical protein n=1 Tax=Amycolatopsis japonica TaxID=208439 RepID=UPI0033C7DBF9